MVYRTFKDIPKRAAFGKVLCDKAVNIARNLKDDGHQCKLASMVYKFFRLKVNCVKRSIS